MFFYKMLKDILHTRPVFCRYRGEYLKNKVIFPGHLLKESRTDFCYKNFNESNQIGLSPLAEVSNLRNDFPPEYLHAVLLDDALWEITVLFFSIM